MKTVKLRFKKGEIFDEVDEIAYRMDCPVVKVSDNELDSSVKATQNFEIIIKNYRNVPKSPNKGKLAP